MKHSGKIGSIKVTFSKWPQDTDLVVQMQHKRITGRPGLPAFLSETFQNKYSDSNLFPDDSLRIINRAAITKQSDPPVTALNPIIKQTRHYLFCCDNFPLPHTNNC